VDSFGHHRISAKQWMHDLNAPPLDESLSKAPPGGSLQADTKAFSGNSDVHPTAYEAHSVEMLQADTEVPSRSPCAQTHETNSPAKVREVPLVEAKSVEVPQAVTEVPSGND